MHECGAGVPPAVSIVHRTRPAMGTLFEAILCGEDEEHLTAVADSILDEVQRIERLLSRFDPRSEISRINRLASQEPLLVDHEVAALLQMCFDANRRTHGAFDITASAGAPACREAAPTQFDAARRLVRFTSPSVQLDLGGIGKGYALDCAAELLAEHNVEHALIHGGTSSALARGCDPSGQPWRVALRHPITAEEVQTIELKDAALSCSAVDEQNDIIDPRTGQPVIASVACAVIAQSATEAEIFSTAFVCLGREQANRFIEQEAMNELECIWIE